MTWYWETNDKFPRYVIKLHILTPTSSHLRSYRPACYMNKIAHGQGVKGHKAEHPMNPQPRSQPPSGDLWIFISQRNVLFHGLLTLFSSPPPGTLDSCTLESHRHYPVDINMGWSEIGQPRPADFDPLAIIRNQSWGALWFGWGRWVWQTLATVGYLPFWETKMVRLCIFLCIRKRTH